MLRTGGAAGSGVWKPHLVATPTLLSSAKATSHRWGRWAFAQGERTVPLEVGVTMEALIFRYPATYWFILSSKCSMPLQQPLETGFYLQSKGNHKYRHEHTTRIHLNI